MKYCPKSLYLKTHFSIISQSVLNEEPYQINNLQICDDDAKNFITCDISYSDNKLTITSSDNRSLVIESPKNVSIFCRIPITITYQLGEDDTITFETILLSDFFDRLVKNNHFPIHSVDLYAVVRNGYNMNGFNNKTLDLLERKVFTKEELLLISDGIRKHEEDNKNRVLTLL